MLRGTKKKHEQHGSGSWLETLTLYGSVRENERGNGKMTREELSQQILDDLKNNTTPRYPKYQVEKELFWSVLRELKNKGLIYYDTIEDKTSIFYGEPRYIRLIKR